MTFKQLIRRLNLFPLIVLVIVSSTMLYSACGDGSHFSGSSATETGALSFSLVLHESDTNLQALSAVIDCAAESVATVEAAVYDSDDEFLASGGPWDCDAGQGTISSVPVGSGRVAVILGKDSLGNIVFRGHKTDIQVDNGVENDAGVIDCYMFTPSLQAPADDAMVNADAMGLAWNNVAGASQYRVVVSENDDLTAPFIDETMVSVIYKPLGLSDAKTYYWQVVASDSYDNIGLGSQIRSFSVDAQHVNAKPVAEITSPAQGSTYTTEDSITFAGSGSDNEDGDLSGGHLLWSSDIDGPIGDGETFTSIPLSAGNHQIILTAYDSEGATGTDTVAVSVTADPTNTAPVAQITNPANGSTFTTGDNIAFSGIGSDNEDGYLSGNALEWRSSINGKIGTGESFTSDALSAGTHQITLMATDSALVTGTDTVEIIVTSLGPHGITTLDSAGDVGRYSTIAVEDGRVFIGYYDETNQSLKVGRSLYDGANWSFSTIPCNCQMGEGASIALDGDNVFISSSMTLAPIANRMGISVSSDGGDSWDASMILPDDGRTGNSSLDEYTTSIIVDGTSIYISYARTVARTMTILKSSYAASDWTIAEILPPQDKSENGFYSAMVENGGGYLFISHSGYTEADVYFTMVPKTLTDSYTFLVDQIGGQGNRGYTTSATATVIEGGDMLVTYIYIAYFDQIGDNLDLKFKRTDSYGKYFFASTVDSSSTVIGKYPSMAYSDGTIFISYYDEANGNLKLARSSDNGESWNISTVDDATDNVGLFTSLAVDGPKVYISYYDESNKNLKFAKSVDGGDSW
jgi:hypothetical protein